ncbi:MAG: FMN-binding protein [Deltaproteobacteria bacterium]|nr:FMN-binding protein [Deltaproteobacteria bacterium]
MGRASASRAVLVLLLLGGLLATFSVAAPAARAKVFASQKQALAEAFPDATRIERKTFVLRREQSARIGELLGVRADAKVVVIHVAYQGETVVGFAEIAVHKVRTQPEALLLVLSPQGRVRSVRIIAFHEPLDYMPTDRWYAQFVGKGKGDGLGLDREIHGVVGATLSAQAAVDAVRRILAYWEVLLLPAYGPGEAP